MLGALVLLAAGCGGGDGSPDTGPTDAGPEDADATADAIVDGGPDTRPPEVMIPPDAVRVTEAEAEAGRASCAYARGAMPWETVGEEQAIGAEMPIDHIIMLMQENRSFDHYFGTMPGVEGFPSDYTNPDSTGAPVAPFHTTDFCIDDVEHSWRASHEQYADGAMDGFVLTNEPAGERAMGYLTDADMPFYWDLYSTFAMSDHHHCSVLAGTWTNRFYYMSGTSFGRARNDAAPMDILATFDDAGEDYLLLQQLDRASVAWKVYVSDVPFVLGGYGRYAGRHLRQVQPLERFFSDLEADTLPAVSYVDPSFNSGVEQTDEHPPANPQSGQAFVRELVQAVMASPAWSRTALIITYDEHGGFFDHVAPPQACPPDGLSPELRVGEPAGEFDRLGFRVPLVVVSPYARAGHVSDRVTDLTSVLRFVQTRFLLPALTARDANAWPLLDMFDWEDPAFMTPPTLAPAPIDDARMAECRRLYPG